MIYIETEGGANIVSKDYYINGTMTMQGNDEFNDGLYSGVIEIKGRGNSTWGMPKKPYKIKLDKSTNIWGMGKNKHWVLLANYSDPSLMRNTISYNLSGDMGMPQMDTTWVDVVLNGKYVGNYQFCEHIRIAKDRIDIYDWETAGEDAADAIAEAEGFSKDDKKELEGYMSENLAWTTSKEVTFNGKTYQVEDYCEIEDINGGYLLELDEYYDEVSKFKTNKNQPIMFKKPEFANTNKDMMDFVKNYIQGFEDAVYSDNFYAAYNGKNMHYSELFDMDSLVDYWIINEVFYNEEFNKKSTYMYKDIDGLFHMGPIWDMDYSSGGEGFTYVTNQWATKAFNTNLQANMWYKQLIKDPYFMMRVQERYWEIRDTLLEDIIKTGGKIDTAYDYIYESAKKNEAMWPYKNGFDGGVNTFKTWLKTHLAWMDAQLETEDSFVNSLNAYNASNNISIQASDVNGALKVDNISKHAKADAVIEDGKDMALSVSVNQQGAVDAAVYVNGIYCKKADLNDGRADVALTAEELSANSGEKDVIRIDGRDKTGKVVASNYMTILEYEEKPEIADKSKLEALIAEAEAKVKELDDYTQESANTLLKTLEVGREVMKDANSSQGMVDLTMNMIQAALNGLTRKPAEVKPADKTALQEAIAFVENSDLSIYTEQSVEILVKALDAAYAVMKDEALGEDDQAVVNRVKDTLIAAFETLVLKETPAVNKDALKKLIDKSVQFDSDKDLYTEESFNVFKKAYDEAVRVYQDGKATQEEVDEARANLESGRWQLREKPNKDKLEELIAVIKAINFEQYSKEDVKAVKAAYASAVAILADEKATQTEIDKAVEKLEMTVNALDEEILASVENNETEISAGITKDEKENKTMKAAAAEKTSVKTSAKTTVNTGDKTNSALPATACLTAILAAVILYRRRRYHS